jgi:adenylate cyclase
MLLVCALPLVFLAFRTRALMREGFEASEKQLEETVVRQVGAVLEQRLAQTAGVAVRAGRVLGDREIPEAIRLSLLMDMLGDEELLSTIGVYGSDRKLIDEIRAKNATGGPVSPPLLPELANEANVWLPVTFAADGTPIIQCIVPVSRSGTVTGFVLARLDSKKLDEIVEAGTQGLTQSNKRNPVYVVTPQGERIAGSGDIARARAFLAHVHAPPELHVLFSWPALQFQGESVNAALLPLDSRDWRVLMIRTEQEAYPAMFAAVAELVRWSVLVAVLAVLLGVWLARRTANPIVRLVELTKSYAERRFTERSGVSTGDELELLGNSLESMAGSLAKSEVEIARRSRVESDLSRYLPEHIAKSIAAGEASIRLGGERKVVSIVFADVVAFTKFSDSAEPEQVVLFLNEMFGLLSEIVFRHGGTVDKFMGDCLMAIFGAPVGENHEARALACAEDMHRFVDTMRTAWKAQFSFEVNLGIGVASGAAVVGNLGSEKRMEYTAIGDVVNVAARLESMARPGQTLLTGICAKGAGDRFEYAPLGAQMLRGKSEKVEVYELVNE